MNLKLALAASLSSALLCTALPASAQKMYRCGSVYQDRPCASGTESKTLSGGGVPTATASAASAVAADAECTKRGSAAQKIKWVREAGKTEEQQLVGATSQYDRDLIADVYQRQGTSGQVRAAIEADCMQAKQRAAQAAALLEAMRKAQGAGGKDAKQP